MTIGNEKQTVIKAILPDALLIVGQLYPMIRQAMLNELLRQ